MTAPATDCDHAPQPTGWQALLHHLGRPRIALPSIVLLTFLLRLPGLWTPLLDVDESQFAGFAHVLMDGGHPYIDSVDTKPPGIYLFYQTLLTIFGRTNMGAVHAVMIAIHILTALCLYGIGRRLGRPQAGLWAALLYAVFSTTQAPKITSANIASIMALPLTASVLMLLGVRGTTFRDLGRAALAGALVAVALTLKYQAAVHLPLALALLLVGCKRRFWAPALAFSLPLGLMALAVWAYLQAHGAVADFWRWSVVGSLHYLNLGSQNLPWLTSLVVRGGRYIGPSAAVWVLAVTFVAVRVRDTYKRRQTAADEPSGRLQWVLVAWFALDFIATAAGGRFYAHYFLQSLPSAAMLAGLQLQRGWPRWTGRRFWRRPVLIALLALPAVIFAVPRYAYDWFQDHFPDDDPRRLQPIVGYLKQHSEPTDRIFVWGFATPIYFFSELRPASRFLWADLLTGRAPGPNRRRVAEQATDSYAVPEAWDAFMEDLQRHRPRYIVDTAPGNFHQYERFPITNYPHIRQYLDQNYVREREADGVVYYRRRS